MGSRFQIKTSIEHKTLIKKGYSIHYYISGDKSKDAIIFLHPAFGDHRCFDKQIDFFAQNYFVITIDMLGHGLSQVRKSKDKIDSSIEHILEILNTEGKESAHIVGVSMGSLIAQYFAVQYPKRILSLTVIGGYSINKDNKELAKAQRKEMFKWLFKMIFSMKAFRKYIASVTLCNEEEQNRFYESACLFTRKSFKVMPGLNKVIKPRENIKREYPLLILCGDHDIELAQRSNKAWHESEASSNFYLINNAGHCANMDNTEKFNEIVMNFVR